MITRCVTALSLFFSAAVCGAAGVESFTPHGEVARVRQVTARFDEAVVSFGDPRAPTPFDVDCAERGTARWIDARNWSYDFEADLPAGIRCTFSVKPGLRTLGGAPIESKSFTFTTGGPKIAASYPANGSRDVRENDAFLLQLNVPAREATVVAHARCRLRAGGEELPVELLDDSARAALEKRYGIAPQPPRPRIALRCARPLPASAAVELVWGKAIESASGVASEHDQKLEFSVRPPFTATPACASARAVKGCHPEVSVTVSFNAPVPREVAERVRIKLADGTVRETMALPPAATTTHNVAFRAPFPENSDVVVLLPPDLRDEDGRALTNADSFPRTLHIGEPEPSLAMPLAGMIVERNAGASLSVRLQSVEARVPYRYARIERADAAATDAEVIARMGEHYARLYSSDYRTRSVMREGETGIRGFLQKRLGRTVAEHVPLPLERPGFYVIEVDSEQLGTSRGGARYVRALALVTNLAVHFKNTHDNALAWVTRLDTGTPVADAAVAVRDCHGRTLWEGRSDAHGIARIERGIPDGERCTYLSGALVSARAGDDFGFTLTTWAYRSVHPPGAPFDYTPTEQPLHKAHTVLDRPLFRAGETVRMKHYVRRETLEGFALPGTAPNGTIEIVHVPTGSTAYSPIEWRADGTGTSSLALAADAKLGAYRLMLDAGDGRRLASGTFRVEEFRLPTMRGELRADAPRLVNASVVPFRMRLEYLAGGPVEQSVTLRSTLVRSLVTFEGFEDFYFAGRRPGERATTLPIDVPSQELALDARGEARISVAVPKRDAPMDLTTEMQFADANGEIQTLSTSTRLWPASTVLGMKSGQRFGRTEVDLQTAALDIDGTPLPDTEVRVDMYRRTSRTVPATDEHGRSTYRQEVEDAPLGTACAGRTDARGLLACSVKPPITGEVAFKASAADAAGHSARTELAAYVFGASSIASSLRAEGVPVDLYPDRVRYQAGETAKLQLQVPYDRMAVLVTVHREGIAESRVEVLDVGARVLDVPIRATYAPNVYVSVLMVGERGRAADAKRPAFFHGARELRVAPAAYALDVNVTPQRTEYAPRQTATVKISARLPGGGPARNAEVALAAVDQALLELAPNASWRLLESMLARRALRERAASALTQLLLPPGADLAPKPQAKPAPVAAARMSGADDTAENVRELFDPLLKWQARVTLDANGEASVDVPLNDTLGAFRIVAIAHAGAGQFGTGQAVVRSTSAIGIFAGLPPLVREGDTYTAMATLRNTAEKPMRVEFSASASGASASTAPFSRTVELKAGESRAVTWPVKVPLDVDGLAWTLAARDVNGSDRDAVRVRQAIAPAVPVTVQQATLAQVDRTLDVPVALPKDAIRGRGRIEVDLRATLADSLAGVRGYMARYPYNCLEQKVSRAIALQDSAAWRAVTSRLEAYIDPDGLLRYYPEPSLRGSTVLTSYVLAIAAESGYGLPQEIQTRTLAALEAFVDGRLRSEDWSPRPDLPMRKLAAMNALVRYRQLQQSQLASVEPTPNAWPTSAVLDWLEIQSRMPRTPAALSAVAQAQQIVRARLNLQGTTMGFSTEADDYLWWLMVSTDSNAARAILALLAEPSWKEDIPRMVRGALQRQRGGHWSTTTANAWGTLAIRKFATRFESAEVRGQTQATLGARKVVRDWSKPEGDALRFEWPAAAQTLHIEHGGAGKPWAIVQSLAAVPLRAPFSSGYRIRKTIETVQRKTPGVWSRGDVLRVTLELDAQSDMTHVVVSDPIPGGATLLGSGLGRDSAIASAPTVRAPYWNRPYEERTFQAYRAYYLFVPKGKWTTQYTVRLNTAGRFDLPQTRVEAMYAPEMFGESPNASLTVLE